GRLCRPAVRKGSALPAQRPKREKQGSRFAGAASRKAAEGVKKSFENRNSLTQRRKVAKQTKEFWLSDLCALAPLRDGFSFFHRFGGLPHSTRQKPHHPSRLLKRRTKLGTCTPQLEPLQLTGGGLRKALDFDQPVGFFILGQPIRGKSAQLGF